MVCSPEQLAANRKNSKRSTGPKTIQGKDASRRNGLKHGLTGAGVVIADEDVHEVEARFAAFQADLKPSNDVACFLVNRAALLSVRLDRSAREESARISRAMLQAEAAEDDARAEEFERLTTHFDQQPGESVRKLRRSVEGIDWLLDAWKASRRDLLGEGSHRWRADRIVRLIGLKPEAQPISRVGRLEQARIGNFNLLDPTDWPELDPLDRKAAAKAELLAIIDAALADLGAARSALDPDRPGQIRAGAAARAIFDASKQASLARKYEATNERNFYRALKQVEAINATSEEPTEVAETPDSEEVCDELASSFPATRARFELPPERARQDLNGRTIEQPGRSHVSARSEKARATARSENPKS